MKYKTQPVRGTHDHLPEEKKHYNNMVPEPEDYNENDLKIIAKSKKTIQNVIANFNNLKIHDAIEEVMSLFRDLNKYLEINKPWKLLKGDPHNSIAATTLYISINALYVGTQLLHPVMPRKTLEISNMLGVSNITILNEEFDILKPNNGIGEGKSPFPRIEEK